jgi:hypothetical protein
MKLQASQSFLSYKNANRLLFVLGCIEALVGLFFLILLPTDPKSQVLLGFSMQRLILLGVQFGLGLACLFFAWKGFPLKLFEKWGAQHFETSLWIVAAAVWVFGWLPPYFFGEAGAYMERLRPLILWAAVMFWQFVLLRRLCRNGFDLVLPEIKKKQFLWALLLTVFLMVAIWFFIALTKIGITPDKTFWNAAGVPITAWQVGLALLVGGISWFILERLEFKKAWKIDIILFVAIWLIAAILWSFVPLQSSFFMPGPDLPNNQYYPYSDSANYDLAAQYSMIGQGMNNHARMDKPFYAVILLGLHQVFGQNFANVVFGQAVLLAMLPALLYLLSKILSNRAVGLAAASLVILKEINAFNLATIITQSNSKMLLTEMPTAVCLILFTIGLVRWVQRPEKWGFVMLSGGMLGLSTMIRGNPWLLIPVAFGIIILACGKNWKRVLLAFGAFMLVLFAAIGPWMVYSGVYYKQPLYIILPLRGSIFQLRYLPGLDATPVPNGEEDVVQEANPAEEQLPTKISATLVPTEAVPTLPPVQKVTQSANQEPVLPTPLPTLAPASPTATVLASGELKTPEVTETPAPTAKKENLFEKTLVKVQNVAGFISAHFFHNLVTSILSLPTSLVFEDPVQVVKWEGSFWTDEWNGGLSLWQGLVLALNLCVLAVGTAWVWSRWRLAGMVPWLVFLGYLLANAVARTSGGRYLVPVFWAVLFYFAAGGFFIFYQLGKFIRLPLKSDNTPDNIEAERTGKKYWLVPLAFLAFGMIVPTSEFFFQRVYPVRAPNDLAQEFIQNPLVIQAGIDANQVGGFLAKQPGATIFEGRGLYPRYFEQGKGVLSKESFYRELPYPRLAFMTIGTQRRRGVVLPLASSPKRFEDAADVVVIGCLEKRNVNAFAVLVRKPQPVLYLRSPQSAWVCPAKTPVCDDNHNCY